MVLKTRYALIQLEGRWQSLDGERVALRWGVALRAALSAAPEPRLRRVSAIRLQSLTKRGGYGHFAQAPSSHGSVRGPASIACFRLMRAACHRGLDSHAAQSARCTIAGKTEPIASRFAGGLLRHCQRWHQGTVSEAHGVATKSASENPAIEGQGDCDQHGAAVVYYESAAVACLSCSR